MQEAVIPMQSARPGRVGVGEFKVSLTKKAEAVKKQAGEVVDAGKEAARRAQEVAEAAKQSAIRSASEAVILLKGNEKSARSILWLLSGGKATIHVLSGQKEAEMIVINEQDISESAKQEKFHKIQAKYKELIEFAGNRRVITKKNVEKMKKSKNPEQQALGFDIEIATIKADINHYQEEIDSRNMIMELRKAQTKNNLDPAEVKKHNIVIEALDAEMSALTKKLDGETGKEGLKDQREKIKDKDSNVIPDIVKATAVALAGGNVDAVKAAEENPAGYIESVMANALTDETAMSQLIANLEKPSIGLIKDEKDKAEFEKFMALGLSAEEKKAMAASKGGKILFGLSGIMGLLAYLSWKQSQEGGGGQPMH